MESSPTEIATTGPGGQRRFLPALIAAAVCVGYVLALRLPMVDDAYITLCYARTLATSGTWGMLPGHTANTATSPLNVLLLAALGGVLGSFTLAAKVLAGLCLAVVYDAAAAVGRRCLGSSWLGPLAAVALGTNPLLLSTIGLEGPLVAALMVLSIRFLAEERWLALGIALGALLVARLDTALLAPCLVLAAARAGGCWRTVLKGWAMVAVTWFLLAALVLGSAVPDTVFLKTVQRWGEGKRFLDGPRLYWGPYPLGTAACVLLLPCVPVALLRGGPWRLPAVALLCHAAATGIVYAVLDPPPYHWYFLQPVIVVALVGSLGIATAAARFGRGALLAGAVPAALLVALFPGVGYPPTEPFIHTNWASEARYAEIGRELAERVPAGEGIAFSTEPGTIAFYSERLCVDEFGDRALADDILRGSQSERSAPMRLLLGISVLLRGSSPEPIPTTWTLAPGDGHASAQGSDGSITWNLTGRWAGEGHVRLKRGAD